MFFKFSKIFVIALHFHLGRPIKIPLPSLSLSCCVTFVSSYVTWCAWRTAVRWNYNKNHLSLITKANKHCVFSVPSVHCCLRLLRSEGGRKKVWCIQTFPLNRNNFMRKFPPPPLSIIIFEIHNTAPSPSLPNQILTWSVFLSSIPFLDRQFWLIKLLDTGSLPWLRSILRDASEKMHHGILFDRRLGSLVK